MHFKFALNKQSPSSQHRVLLDKGRFLLNRGCSLLVYERTPPQEWFVSCEQSYSFAFLAIVWWNFLMKNFKKMKLE